MTAYLQSHFDISKKPWSGLPFKASKEALIHQHHLCQEHVSAEHHGDDNTLHIFAVMENLKFLVLKVHEGTRQAFGWDGVEKDKHFLIFNSLIKHYSTIVQGVFHSHLDASFFRIHFVRNMLFRMPFQWCQIWHVSDTNPSETSGVCSIL